MAIKDGNVKTAEVNLPSWMYSKVALAVMVAVLIAGFIYMTPGLNTAVFGTNAKTGPPSGDAVNPAVVATATPTPTPGQEKNQISIDRNDPILAQRINRLEMGGKALMPIANPSQEIQIDASSVYITGLTVNSKVSGFIENRGKKAVSVDIGRFTFITKDYLFATELGLIHGNGLTFMEPGQKKPFSTINTKDADGYRKLGGIPEDLKKIDQLVTQSSYIQMSGFGVSDT